VSNRAKERIRAIVRSTFTPGVLADIGLFGGLYEPDFKGVSSPVLVASADGVGTKLRVAFDAGVYDTVGYDLVSHCVNDILVQGARPLFFLDYLAGGKLDAGVVASLVEGLARACRENGCALIGGETAEMPGFYKEGDYDLAGFIVGVVDRAQLLDGRRIRVGDVVLGLPSLGLHTNGFSLARQIVFERLGLAPGDRVEALGATVAAELLKPHKGYLQALRPALDRGLLGGLAHITGGGLVENIPRVLPPGCAVEIRKGSWPVLPVFRFLQEKGGVAEAEMFRVFNMGIGMTAFTAPGDAEAVRGLIEATGETVFTLGAVVSGDRTVTLR
jgi:phosphoribosylformylglycinamidine cyclo-ligase